MDQREGKQRKQILVTTGATVTFVPLIRAVFSNVFIRGACQQGYGRLVVQYAGGTESVELVQELLDELRFQGSHEGGTFTGTVADGELEVVALRWAVDLVGTYTRHSTAVISHAGVGSIVDTLRVWEEDEDGNSGHKLIVVPNSALLGNHQTEVATAFGKLGAVRVVEENYTADGDGDGDGDAKPKTLPERLVRELAEEWSVELLAPAAGAAVRTVVEEEMAK